MRIVLDIGGSLIASPKPRYEYIKSLAEVIAEIKKEHEVIVVVGGGEVAREYIEIAKKFGANTSFCDEIGIEVTRLNARLLISALGENCIKRVFKTTDEIYFSDKVAVMGGTSPGHTTDAVAAEIAAKKRADLLIIVSDVDGIYDSDPKKNPNAKKFDKIDINELSRFVKKKHEAGLRGVLDYKAYDIISKNRIRTIFIGGKNVENIKKAVKGEKIGTEIVF